jgi:hypothetical protein
MTEDQPAPESHLKQIVAVLLLGMVLVFAVFHRLNSDDGTAAHHAPAYGMQIEAVEEHLADTQAAVDEHLEVQAKAVEGHLNWMKRPTAMTRTGRMPTTTPTVTATTPCPTCTGSGSSRSRCCWAASRWSR